MRPKHVGALMFLLEIAAEDRRYRAKEVLMREAGNQESRELARDFRRDAFSCEDLVKALAEEYPQ